MRSSSIAFYAVFFAAMPCWSAAADAPAVGNKHLGVLDCASSVCHGKLAADPKRDVPLNEYRIWLDQDRHSQAYNALSNARSIAIGKNLGLPGNPNTAKICLDCHADNVPASQRGEKFILSDGVQCEVCHGGAEKWEKRHSDEKVTHAENVANGMNATEQPLRRSQICLGCHLGTADQFTTHRIMGAGHPRLAFELDTYTVNQPQHYKPDSASYIRRKGKIPETNLWITGQLESAQRYLALVQSGLFTPGGQTPELSMLDCFSCHHSIDKPRWSRARAGAGIPPGTLCLQRQYFLMLQAITQTVDKNLLPELVADTDAFMRAGQTDPAQTRAAARTLQDWIRARDDWSKRSYRPEDTAALRRMLLSYAADDRASDFAMAEQVVLGVESLSYASGDHERRKSALDALYNGVASSAKFDPTEFADIARRQLTAF